MSQHSSCFCRCLHRRHSSGNTRNSIGAILLIGLQVSSQQFLGAHGFQWPSAHRGGVLVHHRLMTRKQRGCFSSASRPAATAPTAEEEEEEYDDWEVGDPQRDLNVLKAAYAKSRAKDERDEIDRMNLLDEHARQRKPARAALTRYIAGPLLFAATLANLFLKSSPTSSLRSIIVGLFAVNAAHFWTAIVLSPIAMLASKRRSDAKLLKEFPVKSEYPKWHPDYEDPKRTCKDHILCLMENWVSAICGSATSALLAAFLGIYSLIVRSRWPNSVLTPESINKGFSLRIILAMTVISQLLTRLGAVASLKQFPVLRYQLQKEQEIEPLGRYQHMLWPRAENICNTLPMGIAFDLAALLLGLSIRHSALSTPASLSLIKSRNLASFLFGLSIFGPLIHLWCLGRIIKIEKGDAVSLARYADTISQKAWRAGYVDNKKRWRYRPLWREPIRVREAIKSAIRDDFILRGHGKKNYDSRQFGRSGRPFGRRRQKLRKLFAGKDSGESAYKDLVKEVPLLQRIDDELALGHYNDTEANSRDFWAEEANARMIRTHQKDYENCTKYGLGMDRSNDFLGVHLQQSLDIGLSFDFGWDRRPKRGDEISIHRLRARLAQSTIRRYNQIFHDVEKHLDTIKDPEERLRRGMVLSEEVKEQVDDEFGELVDALKTLIPTDEPSPRQFERLKAMSVSDFLSLVGREDELFPDRDSMVAIKGEVPSYDTEQDIIASESIQYRPAFPKNDKSSTSKDVIDDAYVSAWLEQEDPSDDDMYLA